MKALVYKGPGQKSWEEVPNPVIQRPTDVIVKMVATTICEPICTSSRATCPKCKLGASSGTKESVRLPKSVRV